MRFQPFLAFILFSALSIATLTGCEVVDSTGQTLSNWSKSLSSKMDTTLAADKPPEAVKIAASNSDPNCPEVKILGDLASITQFSNPKMMSPDTQIATAKLSSVSAICKTSDNSVTLEISLNFAGTLGPMGLKDLDGQANYTYPYFLSVITPSGQILSKDVFALSMSYDKGTLTINKQDRLRQTIPLMAGQTPNKFQIVAGFQLSADELDYNRKALDTVPLK
ncbi:MAG: hypothetical protein AAB276_02685 [Pseudomonadota bacterium]